MDAPSTNNEDFAINFNLLTDDFELVNPEINVQDSAEMPASLLDLIDAITDGDPQKKDSDYQAFEEGSKKPRFQVVTSEDLDNLASETNAISTHWQTNWAVNVLRGNNLSFQSNFNRLSACK